MVIVLALYPLAAAAALLLAGRLAPLGCTGGLASSPAFASVLAAVVLAALILAAVRHRDNPVLMSAWLFFFCGELILALGWIIEPFVPGEGHWIEEVFELVAFVPLIVFVAYVVSPLRIVLVPRSRTRTILVLAGCLLAAAATVALVPFVLGLGGARRVPPSEQLLHASQAVLDMVLLEPLGIALVVIGMSRSSAPYAFLGAGLMVLLPEDLLMGYGLFASADYFGRYAHIAFVVSQLYILNGALLAAARRKSAGPDGTPVLTEPPAR
jgi:hypothetical protein